MASEKQLPERERAICDRLRAFRATISLARPDFARRAGMDSSVLFRYEAGRVALRFDDARRILNSFAISCRWLATGWGKIQIPRRIPSAEELGVRGRDLFSCVYDEHLKDLAALTPSEILRAIGSVSGPDWRFYVTQVLLCAIDHLIDSVPEQRLQECVTEIFSAIDLSLSRYAPAAMAARNAGGGSESEPPSAGSLETALDEVDLAMLNRNVPQLSPEETPWLTLLERVRRATSAPGKKKALAELLGVTPSAVSQWLDGATYPRADTTLRLLAWVTAEEAK